MGTFTKSLAGAILACAAVTATRADPQGPAAGRHAHMVFFTLADRSPQAREALVDACKRYLSGHDGTVYFSAGVIDETRARDVNDRDFDVALHVVFEDTAAHDRYQAHPRHRQFVEENAALWTTVRVFDSVLR